MKTTLKTNRLILRPWTINDASNMFYGWVNDPEVTKYMTWNPHKNIEETKSLLSMWVDEYKDPKRINFAIVLKDTNTLVGGIDVVRYEDDTPVIGYNLAKKYWNNGYMTEACKCVLEYLFSLGYKQVKIDAAVDNIGSNRVIQKCGGVLVDTFMDKLELKNCLLLINSYIVKNNNNC